MGSSAASTKWMACGELSPCTLPHHPCLSIHRPQHYSVLCHMSATSSALVVSSSQSIYIPKHVRTLSSEWSTETA